MRPLRTIEMWNCLKRKCRDRQKKWDDCLNRRQDDSLKKMLYYYKPLGYWSEGYPINN